jgi:hypothetical protein
MQCDRLQYDVKVSGRTTEKKYRNGQRQGACKNIRLHEPQDEDLWYSLIDATVNRHPVDTTAGV